MRSMYDQELRDIQREIIHLGNMATEALVDMMNAAHRRDFTAVERVFGQDAQMRALRMTINDRVMRVMATQHPLAADLRKLFFMLHMADEMERIGAQVTAIGRAVMRSSSAVALFEDVYRMSEKCVAMLEGVLSATLSGDAQAVEAILRQDDEVDVIYEQIVRESNTRMNAPESQQERPSDLLITYTMARRLEHVGDCVVNTCRWWQYFSTDEGRDGHVIV